MSGTQLFPDSLKILLLLCLLCLIFFHFLTLHFFLTVSLFEYKKVELYVEYYYFLPYALIFI